MRRKKSCNSDVLRERDRCPGEAAQYSSPTPWVWFAVDRPAIDADRHALPPAELLSRPLQMTRLTQAPNVAVSVRAAECEWNDMIRHARRGYDPLGLAVAAKWLGSEATLPLLDAFAAPEARRHTSITVTGRSNPARKASRARRYAGVSLRTTRAEGTSGSQWQSNRPPAASSSNVTLWVRPKR
jgi:hypothetical protein